MNSIERSFILMLTLFCVQCQQSKTAHRTISVEEVFNIINESLRVNEYVVLDTRGRMDYIRGHLVSSYWVSQDSIESKIPIMLNESRPFIIYDSDGMTTDSSVKSILVNNGITNFYFMIGGFSEWMTKGYPAAIQLVRNTDANVFFKRSDISAKQAYQALSHADSGFVLIDIRPMLRFHERHVKGALSIPFVPINEFVVKIEEYNYPRNKPIIIYCDAYADIDDKAFEVLMRNDFTKVFVLKGGLDEWASENLPIESEREPDQNAS